MCIASLLVVGSTFKYTVFVTTACIALSFCLLGMWLIRGIKIKIPKYFWLYIAFIVSLFIHFKVVGGKISFFLLFASAGILWAAFYNLKEAVSRYFVVLLISLSILMSILYLGALTAGITSFSFNSLFLPIAVGMKHNHLGDLWAITFVAVFQNFITRRNKWHLPLLAMATIFIAMSFSRSALVSLAVGVSYMCYKYKKKIHIKNALWLMFACLALLFIYFGFFKTTLFSRPYIYEGIKSFWIHPLGIGVGDFQKASPESSVAHNIVLEVVTGMGIFSVAYLFWILYTAWYFVKSKTNVLFTGIAITIFINFLFDTTYTIPAMIWLFFITLALSFTEKF